MAINSKDLLKKGDFVTRFTSVTQLIPVGSSGVLFTLTPPQGQRVRLDGLMASGEAQPDISISIGGVDVITSGVLTSKGATTLGHFVINGDITLGAPCASTVTGGVDEEITVTNTGAATVYDIRYTYQFGE